MAKLTCEPIFARIGEARCPIDFVYGGLSSMNSAQLRARQALALNRKAVFLGIDDAGHHILLDRPRELADAIRQLVALRAA
jgi:pimeloyl-ACP methyl ester carboxylesterase